MAVADKKIIEVAINELTAITGQKAVATISRKDIANFKLRKKMPIGVMVTLRRERMYGAAAGRPNQADNIALIDGQVNALEHVQTVIVLF